MACHILHLAVPAAAEPLHEARLVLGEVDSRDGDRIESQLAPPALHALFDRRLFDHGIHAEMVSLNGFLPDETATLALGAAMAPALEPGMIVYLSGELGAGKTTLVRGIVRALGYPGPVKSPTYTLVELYKLSRLDLHHFDFYRFRDPREWIDAGFRESFNGRTVSLIEWPERAAGMLPPADLEVVLELHGEGRNAALTSRSLKGQKLLTLLVSRYTFPSSASSA